MDSFFNELKRRNVLRVLVAYIALGWLVIQIADVLTPAFNLPEWTLRFLVVMGLLGLPFILFFSWAFEITPEGIKRAQEVNPEESITAVTGKKLDYTIIVLLVVTLSYNIYVGSSSEPVQTQNPVTTDLNETEQSVKSDAEKSHTSIAVLPFTNMSSDPEQEYFSDGISEELLNLLAKIPNLKVAARTSSFQFKNKHADIQDIAKQLGVETVLEGSIRKSGDKVRITAQLIKADDGFHLWSETYDETLDDVFHIQDKISASIVESLKVSLGIELQTVAREKVTINPLAHDYYLKGLQGINTSTFESLRMAEDFLQRAVNLEPEYTDARIALADSIYSQHEIGDIQGDGQIEQAIALTEYVLERQPKNADAFYLLAQIYESDGQDTDKGADYARQAYALEPNHPDLLPTLATYSFSGKLRTLVERDTLTEHFQEMIKRDPLNYELYYGWGIINSINYLDYETAKRMYIQAAELAPENGNPRFFLAGIYAYRFGDLVNAIPHIEQTYANDPSDPDGPIYLAISYLTLGLTDKSEQWINKALTIMPNSGQARYVKAGLLNYLGEKNKALELIKDSLRDDHVFFRRYSYQAIVSIGVYLLMEQKDYNGARDFILKHYPDLKNFPNESESELPNNLVSQVSQYAVLERVAGNQTKATQLAKHLEFLTEERVRDNKPALTNFNYMRLAYVQVAKDSDDKALDYLEKAIDKDYFFEWPMFLAARPEFLHLQDHSRFKALLDRIKQRMAEQRKFLATATNSN